MENTVDVAEIIAKIKQATEQMLKQEKNEQIISKNNNKIKCYFFCKHGYTQENCKCLKKAVI